jgi:hypothetical protein
LTGLFHAQGSILLKTHGYDRRGKVPALPRTTPKVCKTCEGWFAARPRETACDGCVPPSVRTKRAILEAGQAHHTRTAPRVGKRAGQGGGNNAFRHVFSDVLNLDFEAPLSDPRSRSLECRVLAYEEAARERWKRGRAPVSPETLAEAA